MFFISQSYRQRDTTGQGEPSDLPPTTLKGSLSQFNFKQNNKITYLNKITLLVLKV